MKAILAVSRKEFNSFFASPAAWLFLGGFLIANLFIFFWAEGFFARNIADVKPLFRWMPILLIFLVSALTMRSWSEERRSGTLESLLTSPIQPYQLILGKFLASLALVALALVLTFPLPITVSILGSLDWGPVIGGYLASLFLASAYLSIGLYMSARTDNPIVALILTVAVAGVFYLIGSSTLTSLFGQNFSQLLLLMGSGSRFESITRGMLDIRDLYYYVSIVGIFLTLNLFSLERFRWANNKTQTNHRHWMWLTGLAIMNFLLVNIWLGSVGWARMDLTQGNIYSLSSATKQYMQNLQEPLLIRGYFSAKSHPLLEPLVPQIHDLLEEYKVAGKNKINVEFVDPHTDQALEAEAAEKYGIRPVPFRMASRYESGVVNSYFNLVIAYGDQYETLSYEDLIEVKDHGSKEPEVVLKNPEYAITRAVRKVANAYQSGGNAFANLTKPIQFQGFISAEKTLPEGLQQLNKDLKTVLDELKQQAGDKLKVTLQDPEAEGGKLAKQLKKDYGFSAQIASLFDPKPFWFYMVLKDSAETVQIPLPADLEKATLKQSILAAVQRMSPGYMKTVAIVTPKPAMPVSPYMPAPSGKRYNELRDALSENVRLVDTDLKDGHVPTDTDLLLLLAPDNLDKKQLFAIDQFLMQGGSVVVASASFDVDISRGSLNGKKQQSGLQEWLKYHGLNLADSMVLDPSNASLPVPVRRQLGPIAVREIKMMPYPHFPDIRHNGLNQDNAMTSGLGQLTLNWASPIQVDKEKNKQRNVSKLLYSSDDSWTSDDLNILPDYQRYPETGFEPKEERSKQLLAVALTGSFDSYFKDKKSPLLADKKKPEESEEKDAKADQSTNDKPNKPSDLLKKEDQQEDEKKDKEAEKTIVSSVIAHSSDSAKLILIASNSFASDEVISLASQGQGSLYTAQLEFIQNAVDWSLDDQGLLAIRSRAQFSRTLPTMEHSSQLFWEYLNYFLALLGLVGIWFWRSHLKAKRKAVYQQLLAEV